MNTAVCYGLMRRDSQNVELTSRWCVRHSKFVLKIRVVHHVAKAAKTKNLLVEGVFRQRTAPRRALQETVTIFDALSSFDGFPFLHANFFKL